ncbi:MAG: deferrochelatase/peroxidase EfeB [Nocardioidaceae bacterium]|nr:deferrochelatase/peroxidase EfeB [Nocardioidaceae bacterium]
MADQPDLSRRRLLGYAGAGAAVGAAGFASGIGTARATDGDTGSADRYPFHGSHQAGVLTPAQDRLHFAAFDITARSRSELVMLLRRWTDAAAAMTQGRPVGSGTPLPYDSPPADTGEALGLPPSRLTLTFGFGPSLFRDADGRDRFGLADRQPRALRRLPHFPADLLDPARSDGDLCVQACADDPQVAVHAIRNLSRLAFGSAALRWAQLGFGRTSSTSTRQATPRNLLGFKDGTANLKAEDADAGEHVWVRDGDDDRAPWLAGGSYLVARRINMSIEPWDRTSLSEQERLIGRDRAEGAPLSGGQEFSRPDFHLTGSDGQPLIATTSHVRLAHPSQNHGAKLLRRGYNFTDGNDALGRLDAGLFFIAFVRDPDTQYVPMQTRLSRDDGLMEYLKHTGSGLFAVPPGTRPGEHVGQALFAGG